MIKRINALIQVGRILHHGFSAMLCLIVLPVVEAQDSPQSAAYRASMMQSDVRRDAAAIQAELEDLRRQMLILMPDDVKTVEMAIQKIQELSRGEMEQAIVALKEVGQNTKPGDQTGKIAAALKSQGIVSSGLKQLSVDLRARETMDDINAELKELIRREVSVLLEIEKLGEIHQTPNDLRDRHQERFQASNEEQKGVTADLKRLVLKLESIANDFDSSPDNPVREAASVALSRNLTESADQAGTLTESGPFAQALTAQTDIIRTLVAMRRALGSGKEPLELLRELSAQLQRSAAEQKEVMEAVLLIGERQDLDRKFKRMQSLLGDDVVATRFELEFLNRKASEQLISAEGYIGKAQANYIRMWEEHMDARVNTREALEDINLAIQTLEAQIALLEKETAKSPAQLAALLDQLQREVAQAAQQQAQAATQPAQPALQQAMTERVDQLQQRAMPFAPEASELLAEAANQLSTATPEEQAQAANQLAEAARELAKQSGDIQALAMAQDQLETAQNLTEQAQNHLAANETAQAANDLNAAQILAEAAQQAANQAAPEAAQAMGRAAQNLDQADQNAAQRKSQNAQTQAQAAAAAMSQAAEALAQRMSQIPGMGPAGAGTQISTANQGRGQNPQSQGNGGSGPSGDNLAGAGAEGSPVEVLTGLTEEERKAVTQLQSESPPREFIPEVQQYFKNIADGVSLP